MLLALAVEKGLTIHQMDVVTAYLNGTVDEEPYVEKPEDFENIISNYVSRANNQNVDGSVLIKCQQLLLL